MTPIEAGSPFTPIGDPPSNNESPFLFILTLAIIATSLIALQSNGNPYTDNKD